MSLICIFFCWVLGFCSIPKENLRTCNRSQASIRDMHNFSRSKNVCLQFFFSFGFCVARERLCLFVYVLEIRGLACSCLEFWTLVLHMNDFKNNSKLNMRRQRLVEKQDDFRISLICALTPNLQRKTHTY
jgi:hypothetical protein